ncbi:MAG TPA: NUDIX hydrolase [Chitinophagaceae bacterium]|nr:NUDIX hydrolase [Chitinophagaceae bacterium]
MFLKIYFNDKPLFLCDAIDAAIEPYRHHDDAIFIDEFSTHSIKTILHEMALSKVHAGIFLHNNLEELQKAFWKRFTIVQAGGGVVSNADNELLMIFRRGKWDLPKGKLDPGETLEQCALREVEEETGLQQLTLHRHLLTTYHTYHENGKFILKESYWYTMSTNGAEQLVPQATEDIAEAKWVAKDSIPELMKNSFPSIQDVMEAFFKSKSLLL